MALQIFAWGREAWIDILSYNLRQAGALWAAWAGGGSTMRAAMEEGSSSIFLVAKIEVQLVEDEAEPAKPHLTLVP